MQFSLRQLMILMTILPPLLAGVWLAYRDYRERQQIIGVAGFEFRSAQPKR